MSRYPGSQFIVIDNSATTATVPITSRNAAAPTYETTFRAPKGPEEIRTTYGTEFYDLYGSQAKMLFNTYKQPLLQASMDINAGAQLICKRAVLDDAKLANATVGVVVSKVAQIETLELEPDTGFITKWKLRDEDPRFEIRPVVISLKDGYTYTSLTNETKQYYNLHKDKIIDDVLHGNRTGTVAGTIDMNTGVAFVSTNTTEVPATRVVLDSGKTGDVTNGIKNGFVNTITDKEWEMTPDTTEHTATSTTAAADLETKVAIYEAAVKEYFFPLFTIFDNGRGVSTKSIQLLFDANSSKTLSKAIYTLKVFDWATNKSLESFAFCVDPYTRNNNTGYTFDIESAVNFSSNQIKAKMHYDSYEKLLTVLGDAVYTDANLFITTDCLFAHKVNGVSLTNGIIAPNLYSVADATANNLDTFKDDNADVSYYYYNYTRRVNYGLSEKLEFGEDGDINPAIYDETSRTETSIEVQNKLLNAAGTEIASISAIEVPARITQELITAMDDTIVIGVNAEYGKNPDSTEDKTTLIMRDNDGNKTEITIMVRFLNGTTAPFGYYARIIYKEYSWEASYQDQYQKFFNGTFDKDIFNLDVYFPDCIFDANYSFKTKLAIQRLAAYRGDFLAYLDMGIGNVKSLNDVQNLIPLENEEVEFPEGETGAQYYYVHDMHNAVTCIYGDIRDPYTNKQVTVTGTYGLSLAMVNHFITGVGKVFAGKSNAVTFGGYIEGTINYIPKIYPSSAMTSLNNIGNTYPSDDPAIINEKQTMCDLRVNYGSYYEALFTMDTEYTLNPTESEFSYINNVMLVNKLIQDIRKACPSARYQFIDGDDLQKYEDAVNVVIKANRSSFASVTFRYLQDENSIANKIFYAAIEVVFRPFAQAEVFTITALNYSTLDSNITTAS